MARAACAISNLRVKNTPRRADTRSGRPWVAPARCAFPSVPASLVPSYSLNDLAARLIASEATADDHRDILEMLKVLSADTSLPAGVCALMGDALVQWHGVAADARERATAELQTVVVAAQNRLALRDKLALVLDAPAAAPPPLEATTAPAPVEASAAPLLPPDSDLSLLGDFIAESRDLLEMAEAALLELENAPDDVEAINTVFRAFHTVKGTSAFLALDRLTEFAHHAESILSRVRDREIRCTGGYADLALRSLDMIRALLNALQEALDGRREVIPADYDRLLAIVREPEAAGISEAPGTSAALASRAPGQVAAAGAPARTTTAATSAVPTAGGDAADTDATDPTVTRW